MKKKDLYKIKEYQKEHGHKVCRSLGKVVVSGFPREAFFESEGGEFNITLREIHGQSKYRDCFSRIGLERLTGLRVNYHVGSLIDSVRSMLSSEELQQIKKSLTL